MMFKLLVLLICFANLFHSNDAKINLDQGKIKFQNLDAQQTHLEADQGSSSELSTVHDSPGLEERKKEKKTKKKKSKKEENLSLSDLGEFCQVLVFNDGSTGSPACKDSEICALSINGDECELNKFGGTSGQCFGTCTPRNQVKAPIGKKCVRIGQYDTCLYNINDEFNITTGEVHPYTPPGKPCFGNCSTFAGNNDPKPITNPTPQDLDISCESIC